MIRVSQRTRRTYSLRQYTPNTKRSFESFENTLHLTTFIAITGVKTVLSYMYLLPVHMLAPHASNDSAFANGIALPNTPKAPDYGTYIFDLITATFSAASSVFS